MDSQRAQTGRGEEEKDGGVWDGSAGVATVGRSTDFSSCRYVSFVGQRAQGYDTDASTAMEHCSTYY